MTHAVNVARLRHIAADKRRSGLDRAALIAVLAVCERAVELVRRYLASDGPQSLTAIDLDAVAFVAELEKD